MREPRCRVCSDRYAGATTSLSLEKTTRVLLPYGGADYNHLQRRTTCLHSGDRSGSVTYAFNSLGFRSEEYDAAARFKVFVGGCSYTFGLGLAFESTWPQQLKRRYAEVRACEPSDVNVQNFGECAASNDHIARTLISQCSQVKPDLAVALFTHPDRVEMPIGNRMHKIGSWVIDDARCALEGVNDAERMGWWTSSSQEEIVELAEKATHYYLFYSSIFGVSNTLRNMLWFQFFCKSAGIQYLISLAEPHLLEEDWASRSPALTPLVNLVDRSRFLMPSLTRQAVDYAVDGRHPGPISNARFAEDICATLRGNEEFVPK